MTVIEITRGEARAMYIAIGDDERSMPVYALESPLGSGYTLTNMRWPSLLKFGEPERVVRKSGEYTQARLEAVYGPRLPDPPGIRPDPPPPAVIFS